MATIQLNAKGIASYTFTEGRKIGKMKVKLDENGNCNVPIRQLSNAGAYKYGLQKERGGGDGRDNWFYTADEFEVIK